ncbi:hypothetical protein PR048_007908 [Dryococelus australis]|uniref:Uncharacterized protein n=1 Tax=Dryococelus australis TaxID=614101 RepID=A0ABQ9HVK9_9NEOP|nr:hypothetical protein PR048_007908 [Dryococelus australis]
MLPWSQGHVIRTARGWNIQRRYGVWCEGGVQGSILPYRPPDNILNKNERRKLEIPEKTHPQTNGIVHHDSHVRKSMSDPTGNQNRWKAEIQVCRPTARRSGRDQRATDPQLLEKSSGVGTTCGNITKLITTLDDKQLECEVVWAALSGELLRADAPEIKGQWKREITEKTRRPTASSGTIPTCENPVTQPGTELGSPCWGVEQANRSATAAPATGIERERERERESMVERELTRSCTLIGSRCAMEAESAGGSEDDHEDSIDENKHEDGDNVQEDDGDCLDVTTHFTNELPLTNPEARKLHATIKTGQRWRLRSNHLISSHRSGPQNVETGVGLPALSESPA